MNGDAIAAYWLTGLLAYWLTGLLHYTTSFALYPFLSITIGSIINF
jgi:hypothetical protein